MLFKRNPLLGIITQLWKILWFLIFRVASSWLAACQTTLHHWSLSSENSVHILSEYLWKLHTGCSPGTSYMANTRCMLSLWKTSAQTTDGSRLFCINMQDCWFPSQIFSEGVDILSRFDMCSLLLLWSSWNFFCLLMSQSFTLLIKQHTWSLWSIWSFEQKKKKTVFFSVSF